MTRGKIRNIDVEQFAYMSSKRLETIPNNTLKYLPLRRLPELPWILFQPT
ncbi:hypothetical protein KEJ47_00250 [Candidatus Bathyarchaeota archaeon]|nr:hypothetical protein [Candidatus Bathyarchaeota archaeon]